MFQIKAEATCVRPLKVKPVRLKIEAYGGPKSFEPQRA